MTGQHEQGKPDVTEPRQKEVRWEEVGYSDKLKYTQSFVVGWP